VAARQKNIAYQAYLECRRSPEISIRFWQATGSKLVVDPIKFAGGPAVMDEERMREKYAAKDKVNVQAQVRVHLETVHLPQRAKEGSLEFKPQNENVLQALLCTQDKTKALQKKLGY